MTGGPAGVAQPSRVSCESAGADGWGDDVPLGETAEALHLDLSDLVPDQVNPLFLTRLAACRHQCSRHGMPLRCTAEAPALGRGESLIPVMHVTDAEMIDRVVQDLSTDFESPDTKVTAAIVNPLLIAISELGENATTHGASENGAWVAARHERGWCSVTVGDLGMGIPRHISKRVPELDDDGVAIKRAVEQGASGAGKQRGVGYGGLIKDLTCPEIDHARLRVWSGAGRFTVAFQAGEAVHSQVEAVPVATAGTWVSVDLSSSYPPTA